ncbi:hypothetical protein BC833DRAFT_570659, partial [Globomyces pollinis-pini]
VSLPCKLTVRGWFKACKTHLQAYEAHATANHIISDIAKQYIADIVHSYSETTSNSRVNILLAADLDIHSLKVLLPDTDLNDPSQTFILKNIGGNGGIKGCQSHHTFDMDVACQTLFERLADGHTIYVPTNLIDFIYFLETRLLLATKCISKEQIFKFSSQTDMRTKKRFLSNPSQFLRHNKIRVLICSPSFGIGFSIDPGILTPYELHDIQDLYISIPLQEYVKYVVLVSNLKFSNYFSYFSNAFRRPMEIFRVLERYIYKSTAYIKISVRR